jgi:hypothetical protein
MRSASIVIHSCNFTIFYDWILFNAIHLEKFGTINGKFQKITLLIYRTNMVSWSNEKVFFTTKLCRKSNGTFNEKKSIVQRSIAVFLFINYDP